MNALIINKFWRTIVFKSMKIFSGFMFGLELCLEFGRTMYVTRCVIRIRVRAMVRVRISKSKGTVMRF